MANANIIVLFVVGTILLVGFICYLFIASSTALVFEQPLESIDIDTKAEGTVSATVGNSMYYNVRLTTPTQSSIQSIEVEDDEGHRIAKFKEHQGRWWPKSQHLKKLIKGKLRLVVCTQNHPRGEMYAKLKP